MKPLVLLVALVGCGEIKTDASSGDDPKITSIAPDHGSPDGGNMITISGTNLGGENPIVLVDGVLAKNASASSETEIVFELPPGTEGHTVDVTVGTDHGFGNSEKAFRYNLRPIILSIDPPRGRFAGGTTITITGRGFQTDEAGIPSITIGGGAATNVQIVDDKTLMATTGAADASSQAFAPIDVQLHNANGTTVLPEKFLLTKQGILGVNRNAVYWIDPISKVSIRLATMPRNLGACALAPNGTLLARSTDAMGQKALVSFDPVAATITEIGPMKQGATNITIGTMAFVGNNLYGAALPFSGTQQLFTINQATGAVVAVGAANAAYTYHSGIGTKDGTSIYLAPGTGRPLSTVAVGTGVVTPGPAMTGGAININTHAVLTIGSTLFVAEEDSPANIYSVNTTTGAMTSIVSVPNRVAAMCQTPPTF